MMRRHWRMALGGLALAAAPLAASAQDLQPGTPDFVDQSTQTLLDIAKSHAAPQAASALAAFADRAAAGIPKQSQAGHAAEAAGLADTEREALNGLSALARDVAQGKDGSLNALVAAATTKHIAILQRVLASAPVQAQPAIQRAIDAAGHIAAVQRVPPTPGAPGGIHPVGVPPSVPRGGPAGPGIPAAPPSVPAVPSGVPTVPPATPRVPPVPPNVPRGPR